MEFVPRAVARPVAAVDVVAGTAVVGVREPGHQQVAGQRRDVLGPGARMGLLLLRDPQQLVRASSGETVEQTRASTGEASPVTVDLPTSVAQYWAPSCPGDGASAAAVVRTENPSTAQQTTPIDLILFISQGSFREPVTLSGLWTLST